MKSDQLVDSLRWVGVMILLGIVFSWDATPAYSAVVPEPKAVLVKVEVLNSELLATKDRVKELEARERQNYAMELEGQRKQVDWWISFLAVIMAVLAVLVPVAGFAIPYFMVRKDKDIIERDKKAIEQDKAQIKQWRDEAEAQVNLIRARAEESAKLNATMKHYQAGRESSADLEIQQTVEAVKKDPTSDPITRLRAEAIAASQAKEADKAYALWNALVQLNNKDESSQFNAGYWASQLSEQKDGAEKSHWLELVIHHSEQALHIKSDMHEAAFNWGIALLHKVDVCTASDTEQVQQLLAQAEQIFLEHIDALPGKASYDLACVYGRRGDVQKCLQRLQISQSLKALPDCEHLRTDKDLVGVRESPEFVKWLATVCNDEHA